MDVSLPPSDPDQPEHKIVDLLGNPESDLEILAKEKQKDDESRNYCLSHHKNIYVDEHERIIECRECGRVLDPFDYILGWCKQGKTRMHRLKIIDDEIRGKYNELEIVKGVLAREKSKVRKINPDAPEVQTIQRFYQRQKLKG